MKKFLSVFLASVFIFFLSACDNTLKEIDNKETQQFNNEKSVEKIYDGFLNGEIAAKYADGSKIKIDYLVEMAKPNAIKYALVDRNGDSVPELCISNELYVTTFWVNNGDLMLWREENHNMKILSNGNCLETHYGGAPNHTDYSYIMYSYDGKVVCNVTLSVLIKNGNDVLNDIYTLYVDIYNEEPNEASTPIEISKEEYDKILLRIEKIEEANIAWKSIE